MNSSKAQYFYGLPRFESIPSNVKDSNDDGRFNDENPLKRLRNSLNSSNVDNAPYNTNTPYPSSWFPSIFFENTVSHPYLIFYNLHLLDLSTKNGDKKDEEQIMNTDESIITQLNKYFKVQDILSYASTKNDYSKISETWNNRFPDAKSSSFSPIREDFKIVDLQDIQSLHLLAFQLNASFFLIFKVGQSNEKKYFNMKLGPDSSDFDLHFLVLGHVDKTENKYKTKGGKNVIIYKHDLWLSLQLIEITLDYELANDIKCNFQNESSGIMFLEMEKRDPIPFFQIPSFESSKTFETVSYYFKETNEDKIQVSYKSSDKKNFQIQVIASQNYIKKINKIKSIVTKFDSKGFKRSSNTNNPFYSDKYFFAHINKSAFLVTVLENSIEPPKIMRSKDSIMPFAIINNELSSKVINSIISYRERLKYPLTYGDIASSNHPLISELCTYNIINIMLSSADYMERDNKDDKKPILRVVPIENDDIFFTYKEYKDCKPQSDTKDETMQQWKKLADIYPQIMPTGASLFGDSKYKTGIEVFTCEDSPMFSYFYYYLKTHHSSFYVDNAETFQLIAKKTINHLLESKVGLNPIIAPIIHKEYMQLSKTCCINYFSGKLYNKPVNDILMRDIQTINEFKSRTTVKIISDDKIVEENARIGAFPIKKQTFMKMLKMKGNKQIPDPSFDFIENDSLLETIGNSEVVALDFQVPKYKYQFYAINNDKIITLVRFTIRSYYQLSYIYASRGNVFSVGVLGDAQFAYGSCKALDTEMKFDEIIKGEFIDAVYLEENSCFIICYKAKKKYCFTGYDCQGKINDYIISSKKIAVKSLAVISRTYFASFDGKKDDSFEGFYVFNYNPNERKVEFHEYSEKWRITENNYGGGDLYKKYLINEANRGNESYQPCFVGSQFSYGSNTSTFCIYKYDPENHRLKPESNSGEIVQPKLNFSFESSFGSNDDQDEENKLLDKRIGKKNSKDIIKSMQNLLPLKKSNSKKTSQFSNLDLQCSICELFPTPIVINNRIVTNADNKLTLYSCDYKIYRILTDQIYGFYVNSMARIFLFSTEYLFNEYDFNQTHIALIVDTCGIGAKFSNMFFGTRFDEKDILSEDIWSGFSYSGSLATIVLLFRVNDTESIYNAIKPHAIFNDDDDDDDDDEEDDEKTSEKEKKQIKPTIFLCKKDGVKCSICLGFNPEIIRNEIGSTAGSENHEITFIGNSDFMSQVYNLRNNYYNFSLNNDNKDPLPNIIDNPHKALKIAKMIVARYLTFHTFDHYPLETIEKYSIDVKPYIHNIAEFFIEDNDDN